MWIYSYLLSGGRTQVIESDSRSVLISVQVRNKRGNEPMMLRLLSSPPWLPLRYLVGILKSDAPITCSATPGSGPQRRVL